MLRKIYLYGDLKQFSTKALQLDVDDTVSMISALKSVLGHDFKLWLMKNPNVAIILSKPGKKDLKPVYSEFVNTQYDKSPCIHIIPATEGAGIETAIATWLATSVGVSTVAATIIAGAIVNVAVSLAISAVASMLAPKPSSSNGSERPDERPSFLYNGPENVMEQGYQVPIVYGTHMTGSVVVSAGISIEQLPYIPSRVEQPTATQPATAPPAPFQWDGA